MSDTRARRTAGRASRAGAIGRLMSWPTPGRGLRPPLNPAPDEGPTPKAELYILKVPVGSEQVTGADRRHGPAAEVARRLIARLQSWLASSLTSSLREPAGLLARIVRAYCYTQRSGQFFTARWAESCHEEPAQLGWSGFVHNKVGRLAIRKALLDNMSAPEHGRGVRVMTGQKVHTRFGPEGRECAK
jgi:hypothetical protein